MTDKIECPGKNAKRSCELQALNPSLKAADINCTKCWFNKLVTVKMLFKDSDGAEMNSNHRDLLGVNLSITKKE